ncbi:T9SS type A sorting domain-containing protein [Mangrovibacterium sp.]|uniref:T9SS type A sorting domain-containing protein n=1 Tax=Mangrovibacterium sp. TaxID=1961364 RepID=UPI00356924B2
MKILQPKYLSWIYIAFMFPMLAGAQSVTIDATDYKQTIDMMGGDMERSSNAIQSAKNKEEIVDWAFKDIAFNVCRVQFDKNQELEEGTKNWDFYAKQILSMKMVKESNPAIRFFATPRTDYDGYGDNNNLPDWFCNYKTKAIDTDKYGIFLADYVEYMSQQGLPISYLSIVKEWSSYVTAAVAKEVILKLNSELDARQIEKPLIIDQGYWSLSQGIKQLADIATLGSKDLYYAFCTHNYQKEDETKWSAFITASTNLGKAAYDDETGGGYGGPTSGVEPEITSPLAAYVEKCVMYKSGLKGEIFFEIWSRGINKETRAIYFPWGGTGAPMRGYYIMKQFANNILDSRYITSSVNSMSDVYTMAFRLDDKVVVWVINNGTIDYSAVPVSISNDKIAGEVSKTYWTANSPITGSSENVSAQTNAFQTDIASQSLNCFIFNVGTTTSSIDIEKNDYIVFPTRVKNGKVYLHPDYQSSQPRIFNLNGKMAQNIEVDTNEISVAGLTPGVYIVQLTMQDKQLSQKIIIE